VNRISVLAAAAALAVVGVGGCSGGDWGGDARPGSAEEEAAPPAQDDPRVAQVVAGYEGFWAAVLHASDPPNPDHPELVQYLAGDELDTSRLALRTRAQANEVMRGSYELAPTVTEIDGDQARLTDCHRSQVHVYDAASGLPKGPEAEVRVLLSVQLTLDGDTWKVAAVNEQSGGCEA
jgi:hypothetical protein